MKNIKQYIIEKFKISSNNIPKYNYHPKNHDELLDLIKKLLKERGNEADLNDIDTSEITDMSELFQKASREWDSLKFENIDISDWNVSNVENMRYMFSGCKNLKSIGDVSCWDIRNVKDMKQMFYLCMNFDGKDSGIENWDVSNVENMDRMFMHCNKLNLNLNNWKINNNFNIDWSMFYGTPLEKNPPKWYKK